MALNGLFCADVPLRNYSLTHSLTHEKVTSRLSYIHNFVKHWRIFKTASPARQAVSLE